MTLADSVEHVERRYDRLASVYRLVEAAFFLPPRLRREAVHEMGLNEGDRALEVGCGTGRNLRWLTEAVGRSGTVHGVDVSPGMLDRASRLASQKSWGQVQLEVGDAARMEVPGALDAALFSLSYSVLPEPSKTLKLVYGKLRDGGRIVIMDAGLAPGRAGRLLRPSSILMSRLTVLGDPDQTPWRELAELDGEVETRRTGFADTYYVTRFTKQA